MNVALTGGSGFVGGALVRALVGEGVAVRALVRRPEAEARLAALGAATVRGELGSGSPPRTLVGEGDVLIHAAARVALTGSWRDFQRDTVDGTRDLLDAALPRRPARVVYVSSGAVYAASDGRDGYAADRVPARPDAANRYGVAKLAAETLVRAACDRAGCAWTILRLGFLYGPGNGALHRPLKALLSSRRLRIIGDGENRIATVHVDDAVRSIVLAARHPAAAGRVFDVASEERVTQKTFIDEMADALGLPRPTRRVPLRLAVAAAAGVEGWAALRRREAPFSRAMVGLMAVDQVLDASAIRAELGWTPRVRFAEGMRRMRAAATGPGVPAREAPARD